MNMIENKMGTKPVLPLIFSMAIPAMISMLIYSLYNIVDSYFVSLISKKALRAVLLNPAKNMNLMKKIIMYLLSLKTMNLSLKIWT